MGSMSSGPGSFGWSGSPRPSSPSGSASPLSPASIWRRRDRPPRTLTGRSLGRLRRLRLAPSRLRAPDTVRAGRAVDLARRRGSIVVARPQLKGVEMVRGLVRAFARPRFHGIRRRVEQLVHSGLLAPIELAQDMVDRVVAGLADAHAQPAELLVAHLLDDRLEAVVAAGAAALAEPQLAERQREVVADHEEFVHGRVLAREDLPNGEPGLVHEGQRLDQHEVEAPISTLDDGRRVARSTPTDPAGSVGEPVQDHPADVVPRLLVLRARIPEPDDDLHERSRHWGGSRPKHAKAALFRLGRAWGDGSRRRPRTPVQLMRRRTPRRRGWS